MKGLFYSAALAAMILLVASCDRNAQSLDDLLFRPIEIQVNPYGKVPLGAQLNFATKESCKVEIEVLGKIPVKRTFSEFLEYHELPVLGLYPDTVNTVRIKLTTKDQQEYTDELQIKTEPLPSTFPTIEIAKINREKMEPGFHLIDMLIANYGKFLTYTIMFDDNGDIRWFMDMSSNGRITYTNYRIRNGNWLYLNWDKLWEVDDLGKIVKEEQLVGYAGDHEVLEMADGKILMGGAKEGAYIIREGGKRVTTRYDFVVLWDRIKGQAEKEWDLRQVLDVDRIVYPPDYTLDFEADWFHINAINIDPKDSSLIVSGRNQGVVKVDQNNNLKWILAPNAEWGKAGFDGSGFETFRHLLIAVDSNGQPFPIEVQVGLEGTEEFEWSTGQHAAQVLENGNILLFDNGLRRNFRSGLTYSRAVEYKIDERRRTIQQVWQYGKSRGRDMLSPITSDVDVLPTTGNRLITAGTIRRSELPPHAKMIEITYPDNEEVFEAHIFFKDALGTKEESWAQFDLVYRGERYALIPE